MKNAQNQKTIKVAEERCIDLLMEGLMTLDKILYDGVTGLTFPDLWRIYRETDEGKLEQLLGLGLPVREAIAKSLEGSRGCHDIITRKIEAMTDDEAEELAKRIKVHDEVRCVLQEEIVVP